MMASDDEDEHRHLNADAFRYWKNVRKMQPNNHINWPFKLNETLNFVPPVGSSEKKIIDFGKPTKPKVTISFGPKK